MHLFRTSIVLLALCSVSFAGDLNPPAGAIAPTPGPEPRKPIDAIHTPGDADSVYKITATGSYYLTGNVAGVAGKSGIEIAASGVTVDLMGYQVRGVTGSLDGVTVSVTLAECTTLRNGTVRDWDKSGVNFSGASVSTAIVESIQSADNLLDGIFVGNNILIRGCVVDGNAGNGIHTGAGCTVVDCIARTSTLSGFAIGGGCAVSSCVAISNTLDGINAAAGSAITGCTAYSNNRDGISVSGSTSILHCNTRFNQDDGIQVGSDAYVLENTCDINADGAGIYATGSENRIEGNKCADNDYGVIAEGVSNVIIRNTCSNNSVLNWGIAAGNIALVLNAATSPAISGDAGGVSPGSTNPSANYTY